MDATFAKSGRPESPMIGRFVILWVLFFLISFGLGYPTLNRYDPRKLGPDWQSYYNTVIGQDPPDDIPFCFRVLVPYLARPFYYLAKGRSRTWDPVCLGLLISNCFFSASAAFIVLRLGLQNFKNLPLALFGSSLYLMNFVVADLWLSGMVDASEAFFMLALTWALLSRRWWILPVLAIPAGFAKESFLVFSTCFAVVWWIALKQEERNYRQLVWVAAMAGLTTMALILDHKIVANSTLTPIGMASWWTGEGRFAYNILGEFTDQEFWYAFAWLLPLGIWRFKRLPKPWVAASLATGVLAIILGGYAQSFGGVCRALFSVAGPVLTLSAASFLSDVELQTRNDGLVS